MDSLIHYDARGRRDALAGLAAAHPYSSMLFTFAPETPLLTLMHAVGRLFPRGDRAPAIEPVRETDLLRRDRGASRRWPPGGSAAAQRIASGFYTSQALELVRR